MLAILGAKAQFAFWCAKEQYFSNLLTKHAFGYDENQACAKEQVLGNITSAIVFHNRNAALSNNLLQKTSSLQLDNYNYRLKMTISADALAYLLRLLIEAGIIIAEPRSQLLVFVAQHFQTAGIGEELLSANSFAIRPAYSRRGPFLLLLFLLRAQDWYPLAGGDAFGRPTLAIG
ncbi:MAG: hypothetical protein EOP11_17500 [Proteobacteria bacterium]|nr:MAG: hypothetical protein EOP11_17500 [Pseudomonadota bacterium]